MAEFAKQLKQWSEQGWSAQKTKGGHFKLTHPEASTPIFSASTPSDYRAIANINAMMRRVLKPGDALPVVVPQPARQKTKPAKIAEAYFDLENFRKAKAKRREWAEEIVPVVEPLAGEASRAWGYACLLLRAAGKDAPTIRTLKERFRVDPDFRSTIIKNYSDSGDKYQRLRTERRGGLEIVEQKTSYHRHIETAIPIPVRLSVEDQFLVLEKELKVAQTTAENAVRQFEYLQTTTKSIQTDLEKRLAEMTVRKNHAYAVRDDMERQLVKIKEQVRGNNLLPVSQVPPKMVRQPVEPENIGAKIAYHRRLAGLSQRQLGDLINVTGAAISQWENNVHSIRDDRKAMIWKALKV